MNALNARRLFFVLGVVLPLAQGATAAELPPALKGDLERIFSGKELSAKKFSATFLEEGKAYGMLEARTGSDEKDRKDLVRYETATGARSVLVPWEKLVPAGESKPLSIDEYAFSKDGKHLLVFTNTKKVWRAHTRGDYWMLDLPDGRLRKLGGDAPASSLLFAKLSPDGTRAAYVRANDLYVEDLRSGAIQALTTDGSTTVINGTTDWVYEEEFGLRDAFRWSPDGKRIAFWRFDTTGVGTYTLINDTDADYPSLTQFAYPKAGTDNSTLRIGVVEASGGPARFLDLPGDARKDMYVPRMDWVEGSSSELVLEQLNRLQNTDDVLLADAVTGKVRRMLREQDAAWLEIQNDLDWIAGGKELLWTSERNGWRQIFAAGRDGQSPRLLTPGIGDVTFVAATSDSLYVIASPDQPTRRYLYRARLDGKGEPKRVTPPNAPGTHTYVVSPDGLWALHTFSSFDHPPVTDLVKLPGHERVRVLEDNAAVAKAVAPWTEPPVEFFQVQVGGGGTLDGWMVRPPGFDPTRKYPILMHVYGEPAGLTVTDAWRGDRELFHRALARAGYIVASVENRGTPALKGRAWRKVVYGAVGVLSSQDQADAVRALAASRPYVDLSRVAVWGWSGGGSTTLNCMFRHGDVFQVGMAVAPVPDYRLYDTIYQERYMGLPHESPDNYKTGSPIGYAEGLTGSLLIVHGSGDDNVHYQGTERLVNRLVELHKPFDLMVYPNRTHAIKEGEGTSLHLYSLLARYLTEHVPAGPK
jgi:dipeptidyl-peptidase-4